MNLYVYFKFVPQDSSSVVEKIRNMHTKLAEHFPGLKCDLLKRPKADSEGKETWMEVYILDSGSEAEFQTKLNELVISAVLPQPRFCESFIPLMN